MLEALVVVGGIWVACFMLSCLLIVRYERIFDEAGRQRKHVRAVAGIAVFAPLILVLLLRRDVIGR